MRKVCIIMVINRKRVSPFNGSVNQKKNKLRYWGNQIVSFHNRYKRYFFSVEVFLGEILGTLSP